MKENDEHAALRGMRRAAKVAYERAARFGLQVPIWKDGKVVYIDPKTGTASDQRSEPASLNSIS